jgi:hypothetical protein
VTRIDREFTPSLILSFHLRIPLPKDLHIVCMFVEKMPFDRLLPREPGFQLRLPLSVPMRIITKSSVKWINLTKAYSHTSRMRTAVIPWFLAGRPIAAGLIPLVSLHVDVDREALPALAALRTSLR